MYEFLVASNFRRDDAKTQTNKQQPNQSTNQPVDKQTSKKQTNE